MNKRKTNESLKAYRFKRFAKRAYSAFNSMHKVVNIGVISGCMLTFAHSTQTSAQTTSDSGDQMKIAEKELEEVTVTASRVELSLNQVPKQVTVISRAEIERAPVQSIQDLLNYAAGIDVQQRGGHGVQADISIRGGSFDQTAILLNGVNLSNPQTGHYSFDIPINLSDIERIEIIHGPSSIIYGASAFSGGINIITKKDADHKAYAKVEAGGHNLLGIEANGAYQNQVVSTRLSAGYKTSDGYINNSDYDIFNLLWQTRFDVEKSKIDIQLGYNDKQFGANTFYTPEYPNQYDKTQSYFASIKGETGTKLKFIPIVYWNRHNDCFQLYRDGTPDIPSWYTGHNYHQTDVYGSNLNLQYRSKLGITSFGAEFRNEGILSNVLGLEMQNPSGKYTKSDNRTNISYALEHNLLIDRFSLTAGILTNYNTAIRGKYKFYPSVNISYQLTNSLKVYSSWNKATRMPTFTDLYYTTATHTGNTNIKPEDSEAFELGFKYNTSFVRAYITGYIMEGKNLIDWIKDNPDDKWESRNITKIDKQGIEVGAKFSLHEIFPGLDPSTILQLGYTRLHQKKDAGEVISNYTLNYLRDKFTAGLNHPIYKGISANWNFRWQKRMGSYLKYEILKPTQQTPYPAFATLDVQINWKLKDFTLNMSANNIFDKKYFDLGNIPQAGFWLIGGISYTLK
ncbi:TonB-dependent receptor plug domain-containing protein [Dysgonomonas macrotermitis]|uniref:Iron complex outermembrane recepter protein n=1 Tax=Dysgonomonas macrotermitis TaxID=1346286 RepID=A0A1M5AIH1_9BACT|nr:TonB-dependent receptor [Dysgonomonas macrotermitis]SHF29934.1 iron complex outermembrane recepter protein [Dysgonomonas macrotermitis]